MIENFYKEKNIFLTGATGFCGKALVEKVLRSCESVGKIYILVRSKRSVNPRDRYNQYVKHNIFDGIRKTNPKILQKVVLVSGDVSLDELDLSSEDKATLIKDVNVVFHFAATVRFDDPIKIAVNSNVAGTLRVLRLAEKMTKLQALVYMSTGSSQPNEEVVEERYYPTNVDILGLIDSTQKMNDSDLILMEKRLLEDKKYPNTYTLSKALSEELVYSYRTKIPVVVVRPALIWFAHKEPFAGFVEGLHGGVGLICGGMTGFLRTMYMKPDCVVSITPVDFTINATLAAAWKRSTLDNDDFLIYNCADIYEHQTSWQKMFKVASDYSTEFTPYEKLVWYPDLSFTSSLLWHKISLYLFQLLPALFFDLIRFLSGNKPMFTRLQWKIIQGLKTIYYFTNREFPMDSKKLRGLYDEMTPDDQVKFNFDHSQIEWTDYLRKAYLQLRRSMLQEDDSTIAKGAAKMKLLFYANLAVKSFFVLTFAYFVWRWDQTWVSEVNEI